LSADTSDVRRLGGMLWALGGEERCVGDTGGDSDGMGAGGAPEGYAAAGAAFGWRGLARPGVCAAELCTVEVAVEVEG
jgi:hypothetical protein